MWYQRLIWAAKIATTPDPIVKQPSAEKGLHVTLDQFRSLTMLVIDGLEGGYYHPNMKLRYSLKDQKKFGDSGETMFGLDRKNGIELAKFQEWWQFWKIIDDAMAPVKWKHYYRGGDVGPRLKELASTIMYKWFSELASKYITQKAAIAIANDARLILHFSYASWNGREWFKSFAKALNVAVDQFPNDKEKIWMQAIKARTLSASSLMRQQAKNLLEIIDSKLI